MSTISFSGVATGIDWNELIEAQIEIRRQRIIEPIQNWKTTWEIKATAFEQLRSLLNDLLDVAQSMDTADELRSYQAASSDESSVSAQVSGSATPGTYDIQVNQLADSEVEIHAGVDDSDTVINNSGSSLDFAYTYAGTAVTVEVASGTTLEQLVGLINGDADNPGVTAYILDDGSGGGTSHHLVLRGDDMGSDHTITIDSSGTTLEGDSGTLSADASSGSSSVTVDDASAFAQYMAIIVDDDDSSAEYHIIDSVSTNTLNLKSALGDDFTIAQNAYATPRGIGSGLASGATAGTSQIAVDDAANFRVGETVVIADGSGYEELEISAVDTGSDTVTFTTNLSNSYAADGYVTQLEGGRKFTFEAADFTETQTAQNAQLRIDGYPTSGWIERQSNTVNDVIQGLTLTLTDDTGGSAVSITVTEDHEGVKAKIQQFVDAYNAVKRFLNDGTDYDAEQGEAGVLLGNYGAELVESLMREVIITSPPGFEQGADPYTLLGQIGIETAGDVEDSELGTLTVDESALEDALTNDFDAVIALFSSDFEGFSDSGYLTFYQASSLLTTPGAYEVEATFDAGGNLTGGRIRLSGESTWRSADLNGSYIVGASGNPEEALWVRAVWDGSSTTQTATVRVRQGIAGKLAGVLDNILDDTDGLIHNIEVSYKGIISHIEDRIEREEARLERLRERLTAKYARLEQLMAELQGMQDWTSQLASSLVGGSE